jgi:hypothetical protein
MIAPARECVKDAACQTHEAAANATTETFAAEFVAVLPVTAMV